MPQIRRLNKEEREAARRLLWLTLKNYLAGWKTWLNSFGFYSSASGIHAEPGTDAFFHEAWHQKVDDMGITWVFDVLVLPPCMFATVWAWNPWFMVLPLSMYAAEEIGGWLFVPRMKREWNKENQSNR